MKQVFPSHWQNFFLRLFTIVLLGAVASPVSPALPRRMPQRAS